MKKTKKTEFSKKLKKYSRIINITGAIIVAVYSAIQLIPKDEKFDGIDGIALANAHTEKDTCEHV